MWLHVYSDFCEAQARVRQGSARDGSQGKRPQSLNPCLELTLKLVANTTELHPKVRQTCYSSKWSDVFRKLRNWWFLLDI